MNNANLALTASNLLQDITTLLEAYRVGDDVTKAHLTKSTEAGIGHSFNITDAAWFHYRYEHDLEAYRKFLDTVLAGRRDHGNTLLGMSSFQEIEPCSEANRLIDRIDLALNFICRELNYTIPHELRGREGSGRSRDESFSITGGGWRQEEFIERSLAFAQAAMDVLAPKPDAEPSSEI